MYAKHIYHTENIVLRVRNVINPSDRPFDEKYRVNDGLKVSSIMGRDIFLPLYLFIRADFIIKT